MKALWTIIVTTALANILAMGGLLGWLVMTDRLNGERLEDLRVMFGETVSEQKAREEAEVASRGAERDQLFEAARRGALPRGAEQINSEGFRDGEIEQRQLDLAGDNIERAESQLEERRAAFFAEVDAFKAEKEAFEKMREEIRAREGDGQFQKSLKTLQSLQPKAAHSMLNAMIEEGKQDEVVAYLSDMQDRSRTKLISEFQTQDPALAAELLERLRTYGIDAMTP